MKKFKVGEGVKRLIPTMGGAVAASYVQKISKEQLTTIDPKISAMIPVALGVYLATTQRGNLADAGLGMVGASTPAVLSAFGMDNIISGAGMDIALRNDDINYFSEQEIDEFESGRMTVLDGADDLEADDLEAEYEDEYFFASEN